MELTNIQAIILSALVLGSLYALMATGLSIVWGTVRMFNFAHGSLMMVGAYVAWTVNNKAGLLTSITLSIVFLFGFGMLLEHVLVKPFIARRNAVLLVIITTLAGSLFLENLAQIIWGPRMKRLPRMLEGKVSLLGSSISATDMIIILLAPLLLVLLWLFLKRSKVGLAIRGVEQNPDSALLVGVNVSAIYTLIFGVAASLAAVSGIMLGSLRFITPSMGTGPLLMALIVVILGGLGNMGGTIAGAYFIGLLESTSMFFVGLYWTPAVLFFVMIVVIVFKPTGMFGEL